MLPVHLVVPLDQLECKARQGHLEVRLDQLDRLERLERLGCLECLEQTAEQDQRE